MSGVPFLESQREAWSASEPQWTDRLGEGWKGTKFLGQGSFGIVGLWEWKGGRFTTAPDLRHVVVKQLEADAAQPELFGGLTPFDEGKMLQRFNQTDTRHIIRSYGGNRVGDTSFDMGQVVRLYLEYCPGGDLDQLLAAFNEPRRYWIEEADLWDLFYCMALGVLVMYAGTERLDGQSEQPILKPTQIVHFDIKPNNLLLGYRDIQHQRLPILKIADFGEAMDIKRPNDQDNVYGGQYTKRGNELTAPPEETLNMPGNVWSSMPLRTPRKGACSNVFQVGCVMNMLLLGKEVNFNANGLTINRYRYEDGTSMLCHSQGLDDVEIISKYSPTLINTVKLCMLRESLARPIPGELVVNIRNARVKYQLATRYPQPPVPGGLGLVRVSGIEPVQPPDEWMYNFPASDLDMWDDDKDEIEKARREYMPEISNIISLGGLMMSPIKFNVGGSRIRTPPNLTRDNTPEDSSGLLTPPSTGSSLSATLENVGSAAATAVSGLFGYLGKKKQKGRFRDL